MANIALNAKNTSGKILVVGGAGYVGSATCAWLVDRGYEVWIVDDLSTGFRELVLGSGFFKSRAGDVHSMREFLSKHTTKPFDGVMHFAGSSLVGESTSRPDLYFENNVEQTKQLIEVMLEFGISNFIFSSTCAVFGAPPTDRISESTPKKPINPYGHSKLEAEKLIEGYCDERGLQTIALRYFNACGAEEKLRVGEMHDPETHLIPNLLKAAITDASFELTGDQYPTPDGTCIRDYIHVSDLALAHESAFKRLLSPNGIRKTPFETFNLGSENGYSVREVLVACEKITSLKIKTVIRPPRPGDPPKLVADSSLAKSVLGFKLKYDSIESILESAFSWQKKCLEKKTSK